MRGQRRAAFSPRPASHPTVLRRPGGCRPWPGRGADTAFLQLVHHPLFWQIHRENLNQDGQGVR